MIISFHIIYIDDSEGARRAAPFPLDAIVSVITLIYFLFLFFFLSMYFLMFISKMQSVFKVNLSIPSRNLIRPIP